MLDKLKQRIKELIAAYESERQLREKLQAELESCMQKNETYRKQIIELERTIDNQKLADAFMAGGKDNAEARKKIDRLIREIDRCINALEG